MPRKKKQSVEQPINPIEPAGASVAVEEAPVVATAVAEVPVEMPPPVEAKHLQTAAARPEAKTPPRPANGVRTPPAPTGEAKTWASPYEQLFVCEEKGFEMGEHHRFKQRVFLFNEKPDDQTRATLKEHGFTYRPAEKAWTITASAENRLLSDHLAKVFAGQDRGMSR
jgi:hypothetical protein